MSLNIRISISAQTLEVFNNKAQPLQVYQVSTAAKGAGETNGSNCTPRGLHVIRAKIGRDLPAETIFVARRPVKQLYSEDIERQKPGRDWIMARIFWLSGCEPGLNRLGNVDSMRRYIYIHGCPDRTPMGVPGSQGCIRMRNADIIELFELVPVFTPVQIVE